MSSPAPECVSVSPRQWQNGAARSEVECVCAPLFGVTTRSNHLSIPRGAGDVPVRKATPLDLDADVAMRLRSRSCDPCTRNAPLARTGLRPFQRTSTQSADVAQLPRGRARSSCPACWRGNRMPPSVASDIVLDIERQLHGSDKPDRTEKDGERKARPSSKATSISA